MKHYEYYSYLKYAKHVLLTEILNQETIWGGEWWRYVYSISSFYFVNYGCGGRWSWFWDISFWFSSDREVLRKDAGRHERGQIFLTHSLPDSEVYVSMREGSLFGACVWTGCIWLRAACVEAWGLLVDGGNEIVPLQVVVDGGRKCQSEHS